MVHWHTLATWSYQHTNLHLKKQPAFLFFLFVNWLHLCRDFLSSGHSTRFTILPYSQPLMQSLAHRRQCQPCSSTASSSGAVGVSCLSYRPWLVACMIPPRSRLVVCFKQRKVWDIEDLSPGSHRRSARCSTLWPPLSKAWSQVVY